MSKPKYGAWQNTRYMADRAWRECRSVLYLALAVVAVGVAVNLLELFVVPAVLRAVESAAEVGSLLGLIAGFSAAMLAVYCLQTYLNANVMFGRVRIRANLSNEVHLKFCRTSYPHTEDPKFLDWTERALKSISNNSDAAEAVWTTLTDLSVNTVSFAVYLLLLAQVGPLVLAVTTATAVTSYLAGTRIRQWRYRHRE